MEKKKRVKNFSRRLFKFLSSVFLALSFFAFLSYFSVEAATFSFSPSSGSYKVGDTFAVSVFVSSPDQVINATGGNISFSADKLELTSLSKSGSIITFWAQDPSFSNSNGNANFEGVILPDGFRGRVGRIITLNFRVKSVGTASLNLSSASALAHDGQGTDVLERAGQAIFLIITAEESTERLPEETVEESIALLDLPEQPLINSETHPDSGKWYNNPNPEFSWTIPEGVTSVRLLVGRIAAAQPTVVYTPPISERKLEDLSDGVWYFSAQFKNQQGWGQVGHLKFQIDSQAPEAFDIEIQEGHATTHPWPTLFFETTDEPSGIDYYEVKFGSESTVKVTEIEYQVPAQEPGEKIIVVRAVDRAGNHTSSVTEMEILPVEEPVITDYPGEMRPGGVLTIRGKALPEATVRVYIQRDDQEPKTGETASDKEGRWSYTETEPLAEGTYTAWAETVDYLGAGSRASEKMSILVSTPALLRIGDFAIDHSTVVLVLSILVLIIILGMFLMWREMRRRINQVQKEVLGAEETLEQAFKTLRRKVASQVARLDGKPGLSAREKEINDSLKEALEEAEELIGKEIKDVREQIDNRKRKIFH